MGQFFLPQVAQQAHMPGSDGECQLGGETVPAPAHHSHQHQGKCLAQGLR